MSFFFFLKIRLNENSKKQLLLCRKPFKLEDFETNFSFFSLYSWFFLGATSSKETHDILYARQKIVVTAKAFGLQAIDLVYIDFQDDDGLRRQSREGALMGFTGMVLTMSKKYVASLSISTYKGII